MSTSGEAVRRYTVNTYCTAPFTPFGFDDLTCNWDGDVDVYADSDGTAVFTCGNGHNNETTMGDLGFGE
ncbi:hypothetical protein E3T54_02785 [Cryobacterium sp. Sr8]|uniref:hypothetical protein n=1 Tax=Cryobacterium sp. Sr8 TaxID=1259203 RepID=UPI0010690634|nr:hypothetical protein [Cryobacterium sp. Sr8]TFD80685.1 hypothetical protein E3T54_02785 [Cryobacterium sp. Sr8]